MNKIILFILILSVEIINASPQIIINEIQPAPVGNEPEWIELHNLSDEDVIINYGYITDGVSSVKIDKIEIKAKSYTIITRDTASLLNKRRLPEGSKILEAKIPIYNNTTDHATLRNSDSTLIDSLYYNMSWGKAGISFERVDPFLPATNKENLKPSISPDSATMGYANSHSLPEYDLAISFSNGGSLDKILILTITNIGKNLVENISIELGWDKNQNKIPENDEIFYQHYINLIESSENYLVAISTQNLIENIGKSGYANLFARIYSKNDLRKENDSIYFQFFIPYLQTVVYINEIMYDTSPDIAEFIELYNNSSDTISLYNWSINDRSAKSAKDYLVLDNPNFVIYPYGYAVIAWDDKFFMNYPEFKNHKNVFLKKKSLNLNQSGDDILLRTPNGLIHDSVTYSNNWHLSSIANTKNISLEKRAPTLNSNSKDSWSSCTDPRKATPLEANSIFQQIDTSINLSAIPNPFSPLYKNQTCLISYILPFDSGSFSATIYDRNGLIIKRIKNNEFTGRNGFFVWNGQNDKGFLQQSGQYILLIEAKDTNSNKIFSSKIVLIVAN